eukprot:jgi/Orpsp1_1/1192008/evm.model.d7180000089961.1
MIRKEKFVYYNSQIIKVIYNNASSNINKNKLSLFQIDYYKLDPNQIRKKSNKDKDNNNNKNNFKCWINSGSISLFDILKQFSIEKEYSDLIYWDFKILYQWKDG